jgi:hypothetical protein
VGVSPAPHPNYIGLSHSRNLPNVPGISLPMIFLYPLFEDFASKLMPARLFLHIPFILHNLYPFNQLPLPVQSNELFSLCRAFHSHLILNFRLIMQRELQIQIHNFSPGERKPSTALVSWLTFPVTYTFTLKSIREIATSID